LLGEISHQLMPWAQVLGRDSNCHASSLMHIEEQRPSHIWESQSRGTDYCLLDGTKSLRLFRLPD
jgi:hypothetical protein